VAGPGEIGDLPLLEELFAIEARIDQNVLPAAAHQPHHHRDIELARRIGAADESRNSESRDGRIAHSVDFIAWLFLRGKACGKDCTPCYPGGRNDAEARSLTVAPLFWCIPRPNMRPTKRRSRATITHRAPPRRLRDRHCRR